METHITNGSVALLVFNMLIHLAKAGIGVIDYLARYRWSYFTYMFQIGFVRVYRCMRVIVSRWLHVYIAEVADIAGIEGSVWLYLNQIVVVQVFEAEQTEHEIDDGITVFNIVVSFHKTGRFETGEGELLYVFF